nr:sigma factor-like helix-turn-helix DNA-binding protein [uncultured Dubosiella sp.]
MEVSDDVAETLRASVRYEAAYTERVRYNKAYYSLDADDGIEYSACLHELTPDEVLELKERFIRLWNALNSLPEIQGRRVDAHFILGRTYREIARDEGVDKSAVRGSVLSGIERMKKYLQKNS